MQIKATHRYDDIISLPHHTSTRHCPMPQSGRAAQFAPFAALTGHEAAIRETARLTENRAELDEEHIAQLNRRFQLLWIHRDEHPMLTISYFAPDSIKDGGSYIDVTGSLVKFNNYTAELILDQQSPIPLHQIYTLESPLFDLLDTAP